MFATLAMLACFSSTQLHIAENKAEEEKLLREKSLI
jgi:hypothetical protein